MVADDTQGPLDATPQPGICDGPPRHLSAAVFRAGPESRHRFLCRAHLRRAMRKAVWPFGFRYLRGEEE